MTATVAESIASVISALDPAAVIITAAADGRRAGCLVTFSTQCSMRPVRFLVCISKRNATYAVARSARSLALNVPSRGERRLVELFGGVTGDEVDKFAQAGWQPWHDGTPLLDGCGWVVGPLVAVHSVGDHVAMVFEPVDASPAGSSTRLADVRHIRPGHPV